MCNHQEKGHGALCIQTPKHTTLRLYDLALTCSTISIKKNGHGKASLLGHFPSG